MQKLHQKVQEHVKNEEKVVKLCIVKIRNSIQNIKIVNLSDVYNTEMPNKWSKTPILGVLQPFSV